MDSRLSLHNKLKDLMPVGSKNVYFQPPANIVMLYPCIVYQRDTKEVQYADNSPYFRKTKYQVTIIERNQDSEIPDKVGSLPLSSHTRFFVTDNLNHDVYQLYI